MTTRTTTTTARESKAPAKAPSSRKATRPAKATAAPRTAPARARKLTEAEAAEAETQRRREELSAALRSPVPPTGIPSVDHLIGMSARMTALSAGGPGPQSDILYRAASTYATLANTALGAVATLRG